ncbi:MAG: protoporphyrinogen oxidase [Deltaproteobacteria bacterium]|nr:protoporphyrinogen oxidase [Deltaproteobacteria bacterium]
MNRQRVVIIGGGIAGLSTAYYLCEHMRLKGDAPVEITLIEKRERPGGNIITEKKDGFLIEGGPDCFLSEKPWAMELCKRLGLGERLMPTAKPRGKTYVFSGGRLHLLPEGVILMVPTRMLPLVTSSLLTFRGKMRMALEFFIPRRKEGGDETLADFVRRRLGREALEKIAEPLVAGVHAGDPETMSIRASFPRFVELERDHGSLIRGMLARIKTMRKTSGGGAGEKVTMFMTLRGGLVELVDALVGSLKDVSFRTGETVSRIVKKDDCYEVVMEGGAANQTTSTANQPSFTAIKADSVVIATPAYITAGFLKDMDPGLSQQLLKIPYVSTATVSLGYKKKDIKKTLDGFGFIVPKVENRKIMAATWSSVKWEGRAPEDSVLIRCFVGGATNEGLVFLNDRELTDMVKNELRDIMGIEAEPILVRIFRWKKAMPQYTVGHEERVASIMETAAKHPGLYLTGSAYRGIGISDCVREGEVAARKILRFHA